MSWSNYLDGGVYDADGSEDLIEVVRDQSVRRPLREEGDGDDDADTLAVAGGGEEGLPADVGGNGAVKLEGGLDLLELVLDERVFPAPCMSERTLRPLGEGMAYSLPSAW